MVEPAICMTGRLNTLEVNAQNSPESIDKNSLLYGNGQNILEGKSERGGPSPNELTPGFFATRDDH